MMKKHISTVIVGALALALQACSDASQTVPEDLTDNALNEMYANGQYQQLLEFVREKERRNEATSADFLVAAKTSIAIFDQIGAAIAIEKIQPVDLVNLDDFVLVQGQALMLEQRYETAASLVTSHEFTLPQQTLQSHILLGDLAALMDQPTEALAQFDMAVGMNPNDHRVHISRAQALLKLNRAAEAATSAQTAVSLAPNSALTHYTLGTAYTMQGKQDDAKAAFTESAYLDEGNVPSLLELVRISIVEKDYRDAEAYLDRIYSLYPENNTARYYSSVLLALQGNDDEAQKVLLVPSLQERDNPHVIRLQGHLAYRLNEFSLARAKFEQSLRVAPVDRATIIALSDIYIQQGTTGRALELLSPLLGTNSADIAAFSMASLASAQRNDMSSAIAYAERTLALAQALDTIQDSQAFADLIDEDAIRVLKRRLATYHNRSGASDRASDILMELFRENNQDETSALLLFNILINNGTLDEALALANTMTASMPMNASSYNALGTALHRQGKLDSALDAYTQAIELEPNYISAIKNRAGIYLSRQDYLLAREALDLVLDTTPGDVQAQFMYVSALVETGRATEAMSYFPAIFRSFPNAVTARLLYARALGTTGEYEKGLEEAKNALEMLEDSDTALRKTLTQLIADYERIIFERSIE